MAEKDYAHIDVNDKRYPHAWKYVKKKFEIDDMGYAHPIDPRYLARRSGDDLSTVLIDEETVASYYIHSIDEGRKPLLVTRPGFEARDKAAWFPTSKEAKEARQKRLDDKIDAVSKKKKSLEKSLENLD
jgi:hypothetical protein